ncbi:hypothetical protein CVT25_000562 [Psilocybe cyanescens]|uniref:Uncharacterized protein n=1 Tax=Psilocybe cyanescens TaxID=93625 RepID=A0A409WZU9_PSICY|nr:hypothetical protein CVT25_000562 [Psilocybe cyanescens]
MSTAANSYYFRRRTMGRAASPPTWACYEQIHNDDDYSDSDSDSCSEDDDDYKESGVHGQHHGSDSDDNEPGVAAVETSRNDDDGQDIDMDMDEEGPDGTSKEISADTQKNLKGKQRAVEPEPESPRRQRKKRPHVYTLRPILTIQKSQGFVWNQDLFVPPYIKDRYIASTSPPNSRGFISSSVSSNNSAMTDYEVEVVEIRVKEGDLEDIIP